MKQHLNEEGYARQKRYFGRYDALLDGAEQGPVWLKQPAVAAIVAQALHFYNAKAYQLVCYCIMANHVHLVVSLPEGCPPLARTLQSIKSFTAQKINQHLGRSGQVWQRESYDYIVRDAAEQERVVAYVLNNPVKAGLVAEWTQWPFTYWQKE